MNRRPLVWAAVWWFFGSAAAAGLSSSGAMLAAGAGVLLALAAGFSRQASWPLAAACAAAVSLAAGERLWADARNVTALPALLTAAQAEGPRAAYAAEAVGTIVSAVDVDGDRVRFRFEADSIRLAQDAAPRKLRERLQVTVRLQQQPDQALAAALQRGDRVRIAGELSLPAGATNSGGFDYRRYLSSQRIHWLLTAKGLDAVTQATAPGQALSAAALLGRIDAARAWLGQRVDGLYPEHQSGYMKGLVLGIREDLDPEQFQQFSRLGLTHILAISGLHVAVFLYVLGMLLRLARFSRESSMHIMMAAIPLYVLLSGSSPSVMRAGIMALLGLLAARLGRLKDGLHLLSAAAILMLAWDPFLIENVSFQLSYIVTIGLIVGVSPVRQMLPILKRGNALLDAAVVAFVAGAVSFPLSIYYFNQYNLASMAVNFILVPLISFIVLPLGAASIIIAALWPYGGKLIARAAHYANDGSFAAVAWLDAVKELRTIWATPPFWWVTLNLLLLSLLFAVLRRWGTLRQSIRLDAQAREGLTEPLLHSGTAEHMAIIEQEERAFYQRLSAAKKRYFYCFLMLIICYGALLYYAYEPNRWQRAATVSVLDVGQGDAILITTADGKHMLVDGGGAVSFRKPGEEWRIRRDPFEVGRKVVVPLLMKRGIRELDVLVISHLDSDHILGLQAVIDSIPIKEIWWNGTLKESSDAKFVMKKATDAGIPLYAVHAGMEASLDRYSSVKVLWPNAKENDTVLSIKDQNNASVVLELQLYNAAFVLSGDIDAATERSIIASSRANSLPAPKAAERFIILKLAHHGSRYSTSEEWLSYWSPIGAVASASATNSYGHPHPDVLARVQGASSLLWRTDIDGEIQFQVTADGIAVYK